MSDQQPTSSPNPPTCDETEAWCNMISCIYSFLTSSTNLAAILEANYISTIQEPQVKQQLYLLPPPNPEFHLSDFPWFLDILFGAHRDNQSYSSQKSNKISPSMVSYNNHSKIGDCNELERVLESMHQMQETFLQSYDRVQGSYDTRYVLTSQCPVNCYIQYEADLTSVTEPEDNFQTTVSQEPDEITNSIQLNHSSDQDLEIAEETVEPSYVEESSSLSDTPANIEHGLKSSSKEDMINVKDKVSQETYFDEYTESNHTMNLPDSKYVSLVNVSDENSARLQSDQQISARLTRNDLFQTLGDFRDVMKSEEIQTVVNKRYNCTLKALITRSAEQQMPWEEVLPKTLEKPRPSLENLHATAAAEEEPVFVNQVEKLEDKQDQEELQACSEITRAANHLMKTPSQDLNVNEDTVEKNLKNVQIEKHEDEQDQIEHEAFCSEIPRAARHLIKILSQDLNVNKDTVEKNLKNVQIEKHEDEQDQIEHEAVCSEIPRAAKHLIKILSQDLNVNEDTVEKNLKNVHIEKHEDEQDQIEHEAVCSEIPRAAKHLIKILSQDINVNKDTDEKNLKNVQIEKHEDEQDQEEHEAGCSEITRATKHLIKILSQDLKVHEDIDEKNLKNVQIDKHEDGQDQEEHEAVCSEIPRAAKRLTKILSQDLKVNENIDEKNLKNVQIEKHKDEQDQEEHQGASSKIPSAKKHPMKIPSKVLKVNKDTDGKTLKNVQIVKHEDEQDQEEHQRAFSKIPSAKKHPMKIPSQDLKVTKDTDGKNLKNVQGSTKNLCCVKHSMVKLVNVQMTPEVKGSNEKVAKQLSKNTGPKLKPRNPIAVKKESQQIKDMKPSSAKNMPLQKPTGKDEQGITKLIMPKRVIPKQYASIESTVRRFIQNGLKSTAKPKDNTISRKPVHPNEMKALQHSLDKAKSKAEAVAIHKNLSSQPVLIPKQVPNKGGSKVSPSAPTQKPNLKSQSVVLDRTSRYIPKSSMVQHEHEVQNPVGTIANTRVQRKPPIRGGCNLKAKTDSMSKKIDTSLKSKTDTDMPSNKPEKASKSQENRAAKKIALLTVKKTR